MSRSGSPKLKSSSDTSDTSASTVTARTSKLLASRFGAAKLVTWINGGLSGGQSG